MQNASAAEVPHRFEFSTQIGSSLFDRTQSVTVGPDGSIYLGGNTLGDDFPVRNAYDTLKDGGAGGAATFNDGFVIKLTPDGSQIVWATYLGGTLRDQVYGVRVDNQGYVYATGSTGSSDFMRNPDPGVPGYDQTFAGGNGQDTFVVKLSPDGRRVIYWTFVGGGQSNSGQAEDGCRGAMAIAPDGSIYVAGQTESTDYPVTPNAYQRTLRGGTDIFVFKLSSDGQQLQYATYLGGSGDESGFSGVFIAPDGDVIVGGHTTSADFPLAAPGSYRGGNDAVLAKLSPDLSTLRASILIGGPNNEEVIHNQGFTVDSQGRPIVAVWTNSPGLPDSTGGNLVGDYDSYIAVVSPDLSQVQRARYVGGSLHDYPSGLVVNNTNGMIYFGGNTTSTDYSLTSSAYQRNLLGANDAFLTALNSDLSLAYSSYIGGVSAAGVTFEDQRGRAMWLASDGGVLSAGVTTPNFPLTHRFTVQNPDLDPEGFVFKFSPNAPNPNQPPQITSGPTALPNPVIGNSTALSVTATDDGGESNLTYTWSVTGTAPAPVTFSVNGTNAAKNTTATFTKAGLYTLAVTVRDVPGLTDSRTVSVDVQQTPTTINVTPQQISLLINQSQLFSAVLRDQFGDPITSPAPSFSWSASGGGTINNVTGLYQAGNVAGGPHTIRALYQNLSGTAQVSIRLNNSAPQVAVAPSAQPNPVPGPSTNLTVLGSDDGGESNLTYTWSVVGTPPGPISISPNGTNASKNTTATFTVPGSYSLLVTIQDVQNLTVMAPLNIHVLDQPSSAPPPLPPMNRVVEVKRKTKADLACTNIGISMTAIVYDWKGREVTSVFNDVQAGSCLTWDGRKTDGTFVPSGTYYFKITQGGSDKGKVVVVK